jgi:hypothetical protein
VKATEIDNNAGTTTAINDSEYYEFPLMRAGRYVVETSKHGFRTAQSATFTRSAGNAAED